MYPSADSTINLISISSEYVCNVKVDGSGMPVVLLVKISTLLWPSVICTRTFFKTLLEVDYTFVCIVEVQQLKHMKCFFSKIYFGKWHKSSACLKGKSYLWIGHCLLVSSVEF